MGGGVMGMSIAWHLAEQGVKGIVVVEQAEFGSGSSQNHSVVCAPISPTPTMSSSDSAPSTPSPDSRKNSVWTSS